MHLADRESFSHSPIYAMGTKKTKKISTSTKPISSGSPGSTSTITGLVQKKRCQTSRNQSISPSERISGLGWGMPLSSYLECWEFSILKDRLSPGPYFLRRAVLSSTTLRQRPCLGCCLLLTVCHYLPQLSSRTVRPAHSSSASNATRLAALL